MEVRQQLHAVCGGAPADLLCLVEVAVAAAVAVAVAVIGVVPDADADGVDFTELFERAQQSDFLTGRDGKGGGFGFDWVLDPKNRQKIIEGNYDNRGQPTKSVNSLKGASFDIEKYKKSSLFDD